MEELYQGHLDTLAHLKHLQVLAITRGMASPYKSTVSQDSLQQSKL